MNLSILLCSLCVQKALTVNESSNYVKASLATHLGRLALISLKFMEVCLKRVHEEAKMMTPTSGSGELEGSKADEARELEESLVRDEILALQRSVEELFVNLCGCDNEVRRCLFTPDSLKMLCQFFGKNKGFTFRHLTARRKRSRSFSYRRVNAHDNSAE